MTLPDWLNIFNSAAKLEMALRGSGGEPRVVIFRMRSVPAMDASGLHAFEGAIEKLRRDGVEIFLTTVRPQPMKVILIWPNGSASTASAPTSIRRSWLCVSFYRTKPEVSLASYLAFHGAARNAIRIRDCLSEGTV